MTAATFPQDLPSLAMEHMGSLQHAVDNGRTWLRKLAGDPAGQFQHAAAQQRVDLGVNNMMAYMRKTGAEVADAAVWFRGMLGRIEDEPGILNSEDIAGLTARLVRCEDLLVEWVRDVDSAKPVLVQASKGPALRQSRVAATEVFVRQIIDLHNLLERCRWAMLESEADADIAAGRVSQAFGSAADAIAYLKAKA